MDVAKLTRFSWWRLTAGPDEVNLLVGRPFPVYRLSMRITSFCSHVSCILKTFYENVQLATSPPGTIGYKQGASGASSLLVIIIIIIVRQYRLYNTSTA